MLEIYASKELFKAKITDQYVDLIGLFTMFPSLKPPISALLQLGQRIMPRYYTIASSSKVNPSKIRIAISLTQTPVNGLASHFLS